MALYTDIDLRLKQHPITKDILKLEDDFAVKASIRNIVLTNKKEIRFNQKYGGNIRNYMFENIDSIYATSICDDIKTLIERYESRVTEVDVDLISSDQDNDLEIVIKYTIRKINQVSNLKLLVKQIR